MSAPQVTPADVEATIVSEQYFTASEGVAGRLALWDEEHDGPTPSVDSLLGEPPERIFASLELLTVCVLVLKNGHTVTGEAYCADPAKFNAETGRIEARKVAIDKLWPMVVYAERERLAAAPLVLKPATPEQHAELREAMRNAQPMPLVLEDPSGIPWTVIDLDDPATLPSEAGDYLVTVETDSGRETHVLAHTAYGKWMHEGEFTFRHGYYFRPIAWAPRPDAYAGEVPA